MPNWTNYLTDYEVGTTLHIQWEQELQRELVQMERMWKEEEQRVMKEKRGAADRRKYPLFFLKEGIV